ncbi:uncharacterized protein LOC125312699 [Rhodamnia argentea]|uniref:Uncharacterized protein LOC125312699 n=1 Tax=Rhodamnia argentea TaxID=178133 RepID=A0ABM3GTT4_9MYRT|nr:uncharacterized protein LOC125312699 [Rhodamnia argentea]
MASQKEMVIAKWTEPLTQLLRSWCRYSLDKFKNGLFKLKKLYGSFKKLLNQTGFGWDNVNNRIVVDDETLRESHIKQNTEWATFGKEGFPLYPQLCVVFGDTYATEEYATGNVQDLMSSEDGDNGAGDEVAGGFALCAPEELRVPEPQVEDGLDNEDQTRQVLGNEPIATPIYEKNKFSRTPNSKRRRKNTSYDFAGTCKAIQDSLKIKMAQSLHTSMTSQAPQPAGPYSMGALIAIPKGMPATEPTLYAKALNHGSMNVAWREGFILTELE